MVNKGFMILLMSSMITVPSYADLAVNELTCIEKETEIESETEDVWYTDDDKEVLAHIIMGEAEGNSWELKLDVGSVVLNRMNDSRFPDTIMDVVFQPGQYAPTWDGRYYLVPNEESCEAAEYLLENGSQLPDDIVWQGNVPQGNYIYKQYENTYFCG